MRVKYIEKEITGTKYQQNLQASYPEVVLRTRADSWLETQGSQLCQHIA